MIGKKLGNRYEVLALIGGGGMSLVYQAKDTFLDRIVALKVLREQFTSDIEFVRRFRREAQAVAKLSHPNIVSIYDVGQDGEIHYLVMEYIKGKTLKEIILEQGPLELAEIIDIAKQICDALEHAHENSIIHRDIKPHNILITRGKRVKVTDFGIARAATNITMTHTKDIIGSVHYFSPEQAKGEITGEKSDIYSLGIVLYEMVTGRLPFEGDSPISIALKHIQTEPEPPSTFNPSIPDSLEKIILKAIQKDPQKRYDNVGSLRLELVSSLLDNVVGQPIKFPESVIENKQSEKGVSEDTLVFNDKNVLPNTEEKNGESIIEDKKVGRKIKPAGWVLIILIGLLSFAGGFWGISTLFFKEEVIVPNIIDLSTTEAQRILKEKDLKMEVVKEIFHKEIAEGKIVSQDPLPDTKTKAGRVIQVVVSKGPELVSVPNVVGSHYITADVSLTNAGLLVGEIKQEYSSEYDKDFVIRQDPKAGEMITEKSKVNLVLSKGPEPVNIPMPSVINMNLTEATEELQKLGLSVGEITRKESNLYLKNVVMEQDPAPGQEILQGSEVKLVVSDGPGPTAQAANVKVNMYQGGIVRIDVKDVTGTRTVYEKAHSRGEVFVRTVEYYGQGVITVYIDGKKVSEQEVS
ncbi:MAG: Stk1 family PASTA domain-containing Ser/Thr kinase [Clostridia bacterium]|nr:Stk1 family PASTA domain-containing Ser/Thr kinase [Clostridia bacterium]